MIHGYETSSVQGMGMGATVPKTSRAVHPVGGVRESNSPGRVSSLKLAKTCVRTARAIVFQHGREGPRNRGVKVKRDPFLS